LCPQNLKKKMAVNYETDGANLLAAYKSENNNAISRNQVKSKYLLCTSYDSGAIWVETDKRRVIFFGELRTY